MCVCVCKLFEITKHKALKKAKNLEVLCAALF